MPDFEARYDCPVCLGAKMHKVGIGADRPLIVDLCRRCGGMWFDGGEIQQLRSLHSSALFRKVELDRRAFQMQCHSCHAVMDRNASECRHCGWSNIMVCPVCSRPMKVTTISNLRLDFCQACKGVWFDNIELAEIWNGKLDRYAKEHLSASPKKTFAAGETASAFVEVLAYDPTFVVYGAQASVEAGKAVVETSTHWLTNSPEIAGAVLEGTGEAAGAVFETIAEIIGGIFSSF
jgi:Zn-finger nucleic acid-binding protein